MNDEQYLLASAYVDGEITPDDRELAERDPAVMAEVAAIRAARAAIADVPPPSEAAKRDAIAAAMAEFRSGAIADAPATGIAPSSSVTSLDPTSTRHTTRWLQVAAVAAAIGLGGIVVGRSLGGGGDDDASAPVEQSLAETLDEEMAEPALDVAAADVADETADQEAAAEEEPAEESAEEPAQESADSSDGEAAVADADAVGDDQATDVGGNVSDDQDVDAEDEGTAVVEFAVDGYAAQLDVVLPGRTNRRPITTRDELVDYANAIADEIATESAADRTQRELPDPGECRADEPVLADAFVDVGAGPTRTLIAIDDRFVPVVTAVDPNTCSIILES